MPKREGRAGWAGRVAFEGAQVDGFAYRPGELVVGGEAALEVLRRRHGGALDSDPEPLVDRDDAPAIFRLRMADGTDVVDVAAELRAEGLPVGPNHVVFAHGDCCCGPHPSQRCGGLSGSPVYASPVYASPVYASPVYASPVYASPVYASPVYASPVYASPVYASPVYASELQATGRHKSSARPASPPAAPRPAFGSARVPAVAVFDTGLASTKKGGQVPDLLEGLQVGAADWEEPDEDSDTFLDPAAGHGTFIAGLIEQLAPGCAITVHAVLATDGDGDEWTIAQRLAALDPGIELLNLSFGGYAMTQMLALDAAIRQVRANGTVVVASAGNDATCRPSYPAALRGVIAVGALGSTGPAPFTNYGPWVRACAPGVDLVSAFFRTFTEPADPNGHHGPETFASWARWSGSSFSAPVVVAALARHMQATGAPASDAVAAVIDAPGLVRIPDLGTIVNLA